MGILYILNILAHTAGLVTWLGNLSIFHYYELAAIASELSMNWLGIGIYQGTKVISLAASINLFYDTI